MATPPPIPQKELDDLLRRIEAAGGEGRAEMIEATAGGDLALAETIDLWLREQESSGDDLHEQGTLVGDDADDVGFRFDLAATLAGGEDEEPGPDDSPPARGEETTLLDPVAEDVTLDEPSETSAGAAAPAGRGPGVSKPRSSSSGSDGGVGGGTGFSSRRQTIEGFEVVKLLGAGGMGSVYLCRQSSPDREVAVKVMLQ